jgi:hypothetical protein
MNAVSSSDVRHQQRIARAVSWVPLPDPDVPVNAGFP